MSESAALVQAVPPNDIAWNPGTSGFAIECDLQWSGSQNGLMRLFAAKNDRVLLTRKYQTE